MRAAGFGRTSSVISAVAAPAAAVIATLPGAPSASTLRRVVRWLAAGWPIGIAIEAFEVRHSTSTSSANAPLSSSGVASSVTSVPGMEGPRGVQRESTQAAAEGW